MSLDKVDAAFGEIEILLLFFYVVIGIGEDKATAALEPYRLGGVHQISVSVHTGVHATVLLIPSVLEPERKDVCGQVLGVTAPPLLQILLCIKCPHSYFLYLMTILSCACVYSTLQRSKNPMASSSRFMASSSSSVRFWNGVRFLPKSRPISFMMRLPPTILPR